MYLIYATAQAAWDRSEQEGRAIGLAYHMTGRGSRYVTSPQETVDGEWALDVSDYELDGIEETTTVDVILLPEPGAE